MAHIDITKCYYGVGRHLLLLNHHGYTSQVSNGYETSAATEIIHGEEKKKKKKHKKVTMQCTATESENITYCHSVNIIIVVMYFLSSLCRYE